MDWLYILAGVVLVLGTGFFVLMEFSLVALDQASVRHAAQGGDRRARHVLQCLNTLSTQLSSCQLGITLTTLLTGFALGEPLARVFKAPVQLLGLPVALSEGVAFSVSLIGASTLSMLFGELVPKNIAISTSFAAAKLCARPLLFFTALCRPAIFVLNGVANAVLRLFSVPVREGISAARSPAELSSLVRRSAELGTLHSATARFVDRSLRFGERTAADVMTPRVRVQMLPADADLTAVIDAARRTGYSRFPLTGSSVDDIVGLVHIKRVVAVPPERRSQLQAGTLKEEVLKVPETIHLTALIEQLRVGSLQLAVVLDEYGGTAGVVTLEDLVEEIIGDISDEHDVAVSGVFQSPSDCWHFPGLLRPDEVSEQVPGLQIPDEASYETVGGFMMAELGRVPTMGDVVSVASGSLEVESMDGRRVERIRFTRRAPVGLSQGGGLSGEGAEETEVGGRSG